jgi:hypothetical protein
MLQKAQRELSTDISNQQGKSGAQAWVCPSRLLSLSLGGRPAFRRSLLIPPHGPPQERPGHVLLELRVAPFPGEATHEGKNAGHAVRR